VRSITGCPLPGLPPAASSHTSSCGRRSPRDAFTRLKCNPRNTTIFHHFWGLDLVLAHAIPPAAATAVHLSSCRAATVCPARAGNPSNNVRSPPPEPLPPAPSVLLYCTPACQAHKLLIPPCLPDCSTHYDTTLHPSSTYKFAQQPAPHPCLFQLNKAQELTTAARANKHLHTSFSLLPSVLSFSTLCCVAFQKQRPLGQPTSTHASQCNDTAALFALHPA